MYFLAGRRRLVFVITFLLVWLVGASSVAADAAPELMKATVLERSSLRLAGQWGIVPNQFLKPASWRELRTAIKGTVSVPGDWTGHALSGGEVLTAQGFGTLLVQVSVDPDAALGLQMNSGSRAYQVMLLSAEGRVLGEMSLGSVAQSKDNEAPASWYSDILSFQSGEADEPVTVLIHYSNFFHGTGGVASAPELGSIGVLKSNLGRAKTGSAVVLGMFLIIGLYHLILSFQRLEGKSALYLAALALVLALREFVMSGFLDRGLDFDATRFSIQITLEYLTLPGFIMTGSLFLESLVSVPWFERFTKYFVMPLGVGFMLLTLLASVSTFTSLLVAYQLYIVVALVAVLIHFRRAASSGVELAKWMEIGFVVVAIGVVNDILVANSIVSTGYWSAGTVVFFIGLQAVLVSRRFAELERQESSLKQRLLMRQTEFAEAAMKTAVAERQAAAEALTKVKLFQEAAHHLNNPLNHILGSREHLAHQLATLRDFLSNLVDDAETSDAEREGFEREVQRIVRPCDESLETIDEAVNRASMMVGLLRRLSGADGPSREVTTLAEIWDFVTKSSQHQLPVVEDVFGGNDLSRKIAGDPLIFAKALIWLFDLAGTEFGESTTECVLDADGFNLLFDLMGLKVVSQEKLQETLALISTLVSPYEVKCEVDGVRVSFGLPLAP